MTTFLNSVDFSKLEAKNLVTHKLAAAPTSPVIGQRYYDTVLNKEGVYNGATWDYIGSGGVNSVVGVAPVVSSGGANPSISINPASATTAGSMSAADFTKLGAATNANTVSTLVMRDSSGNIAFTTATGSLTGTATNASQLNSQQPTYYLARANHTGTQPSNTISDFDTQVRTSRLDQMAAPTAVVSMGNQRLTALATPTSGSDAVTKDYADSLIATGNNKGTARLASSANIDVSSPGSAIDGITMVAGDVILLTGQTTPSQNGLYVYNGSTAALTRASNADISAEVRSGLYVYVSEGGTNGSNGYTLVTANPIVLGTTGLTFNQTSGAGQIVAGTGLSKAGNVLNVEAGTGIVVNADTVAVDPSIVAKKYMQTIGDANSTSITVTHNLNNQSPVWSCTQTATPFSTVMPSVTYPTANTAVFTFGVAPTANQYRVTLIG